MNPRRKSPIFFATIFFVFTNIILPTIVNVVLLVLFSLFLVVTMYKFASKKETISGLPRWLNDYADAVIVHWRICPYELLLIAGVIYIVVMRQIHENAQLTEVAMLSLTVLAFYVAELSQRAAETGYHGFRSLPELVLKPLIAQFRKGSSNATVPAANFGSAPDETTMTEAEAASACSEMAPIDDRSQRQKDQERRWKEWINEEMYRLSGGTASLKVD